MKQLFVFLFLSASLFAQQNGNYESLETALNESENVIQLDLWNQPITELPKEIGKLKNVKSIVFRNCDLTTLPKSFKKLSHLEELSLGGNKHLNHQQVCSVLSDLPRLEQLDFESTNMREIPKELILLPQLKELFLGDNSISSEEIENFKQLRPDITVFE